MSLREFLPSLLALTFTLAGCDTTPAAPAAASASAVASVSVVASAPAAARSPAGRIVDEQLALRSYYNLSLSRDGARLAYNATAANSTSGRRTSW
jgi:hypothetical protein